MSSVDKVGVLRSSNVSFSSQPKGEENGKKRTKNSVIAVNVILGSLAAVGVLGMADILICKGKHISKLTGKSKFIPEFFNPAKYDKAAYDARLDRTVPDHILRMARQKVNPLKSTINGNRKLTFENGELTSIMHYDPVTNVSKYEEFATTKLQEVLTKSGGEEVFGRLYEKGDIISESYHFGDITGYNLPFLYSNKLGEGYIARGLQVVKSDKQRTNFFRRPTHF